jgi:broad specificity phosphatase PhoE
MDKMPRGQTALYLIRHGEAANNVRQNYIAGRSNELPLTPKGVEQSRRLGKALLAIGLHPDLAFSSPANRARQTAETAFEAMGIKNRLPIIEEGRLQEQDTGEWTGRVATEIFTADTLSHIEVLGNDFRSPGGESFNDVGSRMLSWANSLEEDTRVFAFTHGGAIRCFASRLHDWSHEQTYQTRPDNTSLSLFLRDKEGWRLEYIGKDVEEIKEIQ